MTPTEAGPSNRQQSRVLFEASDQAGMGVEVGKGDRDPSNFRTMRLGILKFQNHRILKRLSFHVTGLCWLLDARRLCRGPRLRIEGGARGRFPKAGLGNQESSPLLTSWSWPRVLQRRPELRQPLLGHGQLNRSPICEDHWGLCSARPGVIMVRCRPVLGHITFWYWGTTSQPRTVAMMLLRCITLSLSPSRPHLC